MIRKRKLCVFLVGLFSAVLMLVPGLVPAQQIEPNPNGYGNTITVNTSGAFNNYDPFNNWGRIRIESNGTLTNEGRLYNLSSDMTGASIEIYGTLNNNARLYNGDSSWGSLIEIMSGGTLNNNEGVINYGTSTLNNYGTLNSTATTLWNEGKLRNYGTLNYEAGYEGDSFFNYGTVDNYGTLHNKTVTAPGYVGYLRQYHTLNNSGTLLNDGNIIGSTYYQSAGQTINNGTMQQSFTFNGGTLGGGIFSGPMTIASGVVVYPGNTSTTGTMTVNGNFASSGDLQVEIGGLASGQYDDLQINGNATFTGGSVKFTFINGFHAQAGDQWVFLLADSITGRDSLSFQSINLDPGLAWEIVATSASMKLMIAQGTLSGDFSPSDCDVDGSDLAVLIADTGLLDITAFAEKYGTSTCQ